MKHLKLLGAAALLSLLAACGGGGGGGCNNAFGSLANCSSNAGGSANAAPVAHAGAGQSVLTGSVVTLDGSASSDANNDTLTYKWALVAVPAGSAAALSGGTSAKPTFTADVSGTYVASLQVNDGKVDSGLVTVTVTAAVLNVAPVANAGLYQSVLLGSVVTLDGSSSSDANRDYLTYKWTLLVKPPGSQAVLSSITDVKPTFTADVVGTYAATLVVNDGRLNSSMDPPATVTVIASGVNAPPVANAGTNQNVVVGTVTTLDGSASGDANLDTLTYKWVLVAKPASSVAVLATPTAARTTFTADAAGVYVASLVVNDGKADSVLTTVTVTATSANATPVANAGPNQSAVVATVVTLNGASSSDANYDPLTYKWALVSKPANSVAALSSASVATPTFTADVAGVYVATLIVNDGKVDSTPSAVTVTAAAANVAPVANAGPIQSLTRTSGSVLVALTGAASTDANGDVLSFRWVLTTQPAGSTAALSSATVAQPTFTATVAGVYVATLIVNDGKVDSVPATVVVTVQ
jgi:PKD domain